MYSSGEDPFDQKFGDDVLHAAVEEAAQSRKRKCPPPQGRWEKVDEQHVERVSAEDRVPPVHGDEEELARLQRALPPRDRRAFARGLAVEAEAAEVVVPRVVPGPCLQCRGGRRLEEHEALRAD